MTADLDMTDFREYTDKLRTLNQNADKRAFVITFGCQQNEADGEQIKGILASAGYSVTASPERADVIIVNTCAIREHAEDKVLSLIGNYKSLKRKNPELIIGILGCMSAEEHTVKKIKTDFHYVSFTLEPNRLFELPRMIYEILSDGMRRFPIGMDDGTLKEGLPRLRAKRHKAWVSVMYGCNNFCTYCIVPYTRGRERSRASRDILSECRELIAGGCREITLLGQNVNSYSSDMNFAELISSIADIDGDFIIRFMTSHPKDVSDALISVMREKSDKIAPFFHLPLQSGSSKILKAMNRAYTKEQYLQIVKKLRDAVPGIAISTDIIVGFPGESEEDFYDTLDVLSSVRYDLVYAFIYSPRGGTPAATMKDQISHEKKTERLTQLLKMQDVIAAEVSRKYEGTVERVLADSRRECDGGYIYEGKTLTNKPVHFFSKSDCLYSFVNVKIERALPFDLYGSEV